MPLSFLARLFAIVWTVAGVVLISILVSAISVSLTGETIGLDHNLYGAKVSWQIVYLYFQQWANSTRLTGVFLLTLLQLPNVVLRIVILLTSGGESGGERQFLIGCCCHFRIVTDGLDLA